MARAATWRRCRSRAAPASSRTSRRRTTCPRSPRRCAGAERAAHRRGASSFLGRVDGAARGGAHAFDHDVRQAGVAADLQARAVGVRAERRDPRGLAAGDRRVGAADLALDEIDLAAADGHAVGLLVDTHVDGALAGRRIRLEQADGGAEDRTHVDGLALARRAPGPVVAPARERADDGGELAGSFGEAVLDARRDLAEALAREQAVGDHAVQARTQLFGRDTGQHLLELHESPWAGEKISDDQQRPLVAHEIKRAGVRGPLVVGVSLGGRYDGNLGTSCPSDPGPGRTGNPRWDYFSVLLASLAGTEVERQSSIRRTSSAPRHEV